MNGEIEVLEYIYQNASMAKETIGRIIKIREEDDSLTEVLKQKREYYGKIARSAKEMLKRRKKEVPELGLLSKMATYMGVKMNLSKGDAISEVAQMLIQGCTMGYIEFDKRLKEYRIENKNVEKLAKRFLEFELQNTELLKQYL